MIDEKIASDELSQITQSSVAIILCTYNGEEYIEQQLESIIAQTILNWTIFASDDGSTDATLSILEKYQKILGSNKLVILKGPKKVLHGIFFLRSNIRQKAFSIMLL